MIRELHDRMSFDRADDANIPVDVWLMEPDEDCAEWRMTAANYMPRKGYLRPNAYAVFSDNREELAAIVRDKILPLYRVALAKLKGIVSGESDHLYYWQGTDRARATDDPRET